MLFHSPLVANRAKLESIVGGPLSGDAFTFRPWGTRIVVVRAEPVRLTAGGIHIPSSAQEYPALGWVLAMGHLVGDPAEAPLPMLREDLLGQQVLFAKYAGDVLMVGDSDDFQDPFNSRYTVMDVTSIWGTVGDPPREVPL